MKNLLFVFVPMMAAASCAPRAIPVPESIQSVKSGISRQAEYTKSMEGHLLTQGDALKQARALAVDILDKNPPTP